jgi:hypothetical protein
MLTERQITAYADKLRRGLAGIDEFPDQWVRLQKRWAVPPREKQPTGAELRQAYEEATGTLIDCD